MLDNKKRVYIALYERSSETTFHWSIVVINKDSVDKDVISRRYHVTTLDENNKLTDVWRYDNSYTNLSHSKAVVSLVRVGKIDSKSDEKLDYIFRHNVAIVQNDKLWTCRVWVLDSIKELQKENIISDFDIYKLEEFCKENA
ncbi:hypothetical protein K439DRAFT_1371580 [Ramaria rubella]|nr:hypothetical protein K439DRAFT_1371580 [Ramaria rubella]